MADADEVRFAEGDAARRPDALQAGLVRVLLGIGEPEPPWGEIDAAMQETRGGVPMWKLWQRGFTALRVRAAKAVQAARATGRQLAAADGPGPAALRAQGWEPAPELTARLVAAYGPPATTLEQRRTPAAAGVMRFEWAKSHADGPQVGRPFRCQVEEHPDPALGDPGQAGARGWTWVRLRWASWREGSLPPARPTPEQVLREAVGGDEAVDALFGRGEG